jgi:hypothetical protein
MPQGMSRAVAIRNSDADLRRAVLNTAGTTIKIYGTPRPANADAAASGTLLATITLTANKFGTAAANGAFSNTVALDASGPAVAGTAAWVRVTGAAAMFDDDVYDAGTAGGPFLSGLNMGVSGATAIAAGTILNTAIGAFTYTSAL